VGLVPNTLIEAELIAAFAVEVDATPKLTSSAFEEGEFISGPVVTTNKVMMANARELLFNLLITM
jgi:hypothetical protein